MRILLAHNSLYYPSFGGGDKSNRLLMQALAARGHEVRVVARIAKFGTEEHAGFLEQLKARGIQAEVTDAAVRFSLEGVDVHTLTFNPQLRGYFSAQLAAFDPDVIVTSTDDPGQLLFDVARRGERARVVYLVRATIAVPFGPDSSSPNPEKTEMLRHADGIVGVSQYVADYVRQWSGMDAIHVPISLLEPGEVQPVARFDNPYVAMVNPCAVKGIAIFLALADRLSNLKFAAVPTWGTNAIDLAALRSRPNIRVIPPVENLDDLFRQTRVLLAPSLWAEARSRVVLEAMLRGVPVIASDVGGLKEAKLGVPYLIPVNPIAHYQAAFDENMVPVANVPEQNIEPWLETIVRLTQDQAQWEKIAADSLAAALNYARNLTVEPFEQFLEQLLQRPKRPSDPSHGFSQDKRRLLGLRLKKALSQKSAASRWFPESVSSPPGTLRLFCFPHAGSGPLAYRWLFKLRAIAITPVCLPGRETRFDEAPFENMDSLIASLLPAIRPLTEGPYAFFGHSMGSGVAFELARALRRDGAAPPEILIVSGARAPQLRVRPHNQPEQSDPELLEELRTLGALPAALLDDAVAQKLLLPALRADTLLYRNYVYQPEPPLAIPIAAYGGAADPSISPEHLDGWRAQTTASFIRREFEGGHFYFQSHPDAVLEALRLDLTSAERTAEPRP